MIIMSFAKGHSWAPHSSGLFCEDKDSYLGYLGITQETVNEVYTLGFSGPALMRIWAGYFSMEGAMGMCKCLQTWTNFWSWEALAEETDGSQAPGTACDQMASGQLSPQISSVQSLLAGTLLFSLFGISYVHLYLSRSLHWAVGKSYTNQYGDENLPSGWEWERWSQILATHKEESQTVAEKQIIHSPDVRLVSMFQRGGRDKMR